MFLTRAERRRVRQAPQAVPFPRRRDRARRHRDRPGPHPYRHRSRITGARGAPPSTRAASARPATRQAAPPSPGTATGTGLRWADFHGIQLPVSAKDGPRHTRGGLAWGFADTQDGALLAAVNIAVRTAAQWGPGIYQPTIRHQVTGPDAAALLEADASDYAALRAAAHVRPGQPAGRGYAVEAGFRFVAYTSSSRHGGHRHRGPRRRRDDRDGRHPDRGRLAAR